MERCPKSTRSGKCDQCELERDTLTATVNGYHHHEFPQKTRPTLPDDHTQVDTGPIQSPFKSNLPG